LLDARTVLKPWKMAEKNSLNFHYNHPSGTPAQWQINTSPKKIKQAGGA
jgi:hypothetical protein